MRPLTLLRIFAATLPLLAVGQETPPEKILLNDYRPVSIFKIPVTEVPKARYRVIDLHTHPYAQTPAQLAAWVKLMDVSGIQKTIVLTGAVGAKFDALYQLYSAYPGRFQLWCGFDYTGLEGA